MNTAEIVTNQDAYEQIGHDFIVEKLIPQMTATLHRFDVVGDAKTLDADGKELMYDLLFRILTAFEGAPSFDHGDETWRAGILFTGSGHDSGRILRGQRAVLHGDPLSAAVDTFPETP